MSWPLKSLLNHIPFFKSRSTTTKSHRSADRREIFAARDRERLSAGGLLNIALRGGTNSSNSLTAADPGIFCHRRRDDAGGGEGR